MGALVVAQPAMARPAREAWERAGVRCAIVASPMGGWNGYVQLPWGHPWRARDWLEVPLPGCTWGPDDRGWVGFDTGHAWDAWAPDDDSPPHLPAWLTAGQFLGGPDPEVAQAAAEHLAQLRRRVAASLPGHRTWTLPRLRAEVELWADLARQGLPGGPSLYP